jgi:hypothetical protein
VTLELAVGAQDDKLDFYIFEDKYLNTLNSFMKRKYEQNGARLKETIKVSVRSLKSILADYFPAAVEIDVFNVDTEGHEETVLRSNDWSIYRPKILCVEGLWLSLEEIHNHTISRVLEECGYELFAKCHYSVFYRKRGYTLP